MTDDPVEAILAVECHDCEMPAGSSCSSIATGEETAKRLFCESRIRAALYPKWTAEEIARGKALADTFRDVIPDARTPEPETCGTCGGEGVIFPSELGHGQPVIGEHLQPCPTCTAEPEGGNP